jgi:hypothetical protein
MITAPGKRRLRRDCATALLLLSCVVSLPVATAAGQTASIAETLKRLRAIKTDDFTTEVPPVAKTLLVQLKHQLRDLVLDLLNTPSGQRLSAGGLRAKAVSRLGAMGVRIGAPRTDRFYQYLYGDIIDLKLDRLPQHPDLLALTTAVSIRCGEDNSFYLFRRQGASWSVLLADEADNYKEISGGQGQFGYAVAPPDARGQFFVVTVNINPWCSSNWQSIRYKVLRPGADAEHPRVVMRGEEGIFLGVEPRYALSVKRDGLTLTFTGEQHLDGGLLTRRYIENFTVDETSAKRIAPLAARPEDFLDEWVQLPWSAAARWSEPGARSELKRWHEKLQKTNYFSELLFVQPCRRGEWQIGALIEERNSSASLPSKLFVNIARRHRSFLLRNVSSERPAGCPGEASPYGLP